MRILKRLGWCVVVAVVFVGLIEVSQRIGGTAYESWDAYCGGMYEERSRTCGYWDRQMALEAQYPGHPIAAVVLTVLLFVVATALSALPDSSWHLKREQFLQLVAGDQFWRVMKLDGKRTIVGPYTIVSFLEVPDLDTCEPLDAAVIRDESGHEQIYSVNELTEQTNSYGAYRSHSDALDYLVLVDPKPV